MLELPIDPPEPTHEEDVCARCGEVQLVSMRFRICDSCDKILYEQAQEAKYDALKDEGHLERW